MAAPDTSLTPAVQDYAKAIYALEQRESGPVSTNALAERLEVTAGSASGMVRRLCELGLVTHVPYRGVQLTDAGARVALEVLRHHRLLEALIADKLGHPTHDPHGDPIPTADLVVEERATERLGDLEPGDAGRLVRVSDSDPAMLRYLGERGIGLGDAFEVVDRQPFDGPLFVRFGGEVHALGGGLAAAMRVEAER